MSQKTPVNQKRLTNIALVKLKKGGKRFEIACYKNKVLNWRDGIEKQLEEVIQTDVIFENVSRGIIAKEQDLIKAFKTKDNEEVCRIILKMGELQVSDKEREMQLDLLFRDIVQICVERCVHPETGRQLTAITVENALKTTGFSVQPDHSAKKQSLKAIEHLCTEFPDSFCRSKMRLRIVCPEADTERVRHALKETAQARIEDDSAGGANSWAFSFVCDPRQYRELDQLVTGMTGASLQIVTTAVLGEARGATEQSTISGRPPSPEPSASAAARVAPEAPLPATAGYGRTAAPKAPAKKGMTCSTCNVSFEEATEYRGHCRSEWHNHNLKLKVRGSPPLSEEDFAEVSLDARELRACD